MSNGRILDHHWVERTSAGQIAWRDSSMPMQERGLLNALRSSMKVSELYRKSRETDPQAFLELVNRLGRRGWVARVDEPVVVMDKTEDPVPAAQGHSVPVVPTTEPPAVRPVRATPVAPATDVERPRMSSDLQAMLARYRGGQDRGTSVEADGPASVGEPSEPSGMGAAGHPDDPTVPQDPRNVVPPGATAGPSSPATVHDPFGSSAYPEYPADPPGATPSAPVLTVDEPPAPLVVERLSSSALTLLDLLKDPAGTDVAPSPAPAVPAALDRPPSLDELIGPLTRVDDRRTVEGPAPEAPVAVAPSVDPAPTPSVDSWAGMSSLEALQKALQAPPAPIPDAPQAPVNRDAPSGGFHDYVFDHEQAAARLAENLQAPQEHPPLFEAREAVGEALPLHTLPKADMIPWEQVDERQVRERATTERNETPGFTYQPEDLVRFEPDPPASPRPPEPLTPARASDLGPRGPDPIEDDDLMQQLSRPRRLSAPSGPNSATVAPRSVVGGAKKVPSTARARPDTFKQELQRMQAMKEDAEQQEQARQDLIARKRAEEEFRRMAEETRRAAIAAARADAQRREDAQSLTNLSERMKRIKRNKDSS